MQSEASKKMIERDGTSLGDKERRAMFYILGSVDKFIELQDEIYDFKERMIKPEVLENKDLSSGHQKLLLLAFNLYNNWKPCPTPSEIFGSLDSDNRKIALNALALRFN